MVFRKGGKVVVPPAMDPDQRDLSRVDTLQLFAVPDGDQHIPRSMDDIGMAVHVPDPLVSSQMIPQHQFNR